MASTTTTTTAAAAGEFNVTTYELTSDPVGWNLVTQAEDRDALKQIVMNMFMIQEDKYGRLDNVFIEKVGKHFRVVGVGYKGKISSAKIIALKKAHERVLDVWIDYDYVESRSQQKQPPCIVINYASYETLVDKCASYERAQALPKREEFIPVVRLTEEEQRQRLATAAATTSSERKRVGAKRKRNASWSLWSILGFSPDGDDGNDDSDSSDEELEHASKRSKTHECVQ